MKGSMLQPPKDSVALTESTQYLVDEVKLDLDRSRKNKRKASPEVLKANRDNKRSLSSALAAAIFQSPTKSTTANSP